MKTELYNDNFQNFKRYNISTLRAAHELGRKAYGFEVDKRFYREAMEKMLKTEEEKQINLFEEGNTT